MRQVWIPEVGGPEVLTVREAPDPVPRPGEVRIRVEAAGVNFADVMARLGLYPDAPPLPTVVGYEVAGVVDAVGSPLTEGEPPHSFAVGDPVLALTQFGGYSDVVCVPVRQVARRPAGMSAQVGAGLPVAYLTAYALLIEVGRIRSGDRVLIHGAGGGVGLAALDLCQRFGVETFGTASEHKHAFARERGLHHAIDVRQRNLVAEILRLTGGAGVDLVLDPAGGRSWRDSLAVLAPFGKLAIYGFAAAAASVAPSRLRTTVATARTLASTPWLKFNPISLMNDNRVVGGVNLGHLWDQVDRLRGWLDLLLQWYEAGQLHPHVDRSFPLADAPAAHRYLQERRNLGKVVLVP